jgi:hypothetical protein
LLFGSTIVITPQGADLGTSPSRIVLDEPIEAITAGAHIMIDITRFIKSTNVIDGLNEVDTIFPKGCVTATLISDSSKIVLDDSYGGWGGEDSVRLNLSSQVGIPVDVKFIAVEITSCVDIKQAIVLWHKYSL